MNFFSVFQTSSIKKFYMTEKQRLWADVYRCAYLRWKESGEESDGDWVTMVAALGLGDRFWE